MAEPPTLLKAGSNRLIIGVTPSRFFCLPHRSAPDFSYAFLLNISEDGSVVPVKFGSSKSKLEKKAEVSTRRLHSQSPKAFPNQLQRHGQLFQRWIAVLQLQRYMSALQEVSKTLEQQRYPVIYMKTCGNWKQGNTI